ncbi:TPA: hypothetical protein ACGO0M_001916 [Streptococcus suis]
MSFKTVKDGIFTKELKTRKQPTIADCFLGDYMKKKLFAISSLKIV